MAPIPVDSDMEMSFGKHRGRLISESWLQSLVSRARELVFHHMHPGVRCGI